MIPSDISAQVTASIPEEVGGSYLVDSDSPVGGRLKKFYNNWQKIISDPTILEAVRGYKIEFDCNIPLPERSLCSSPF